MGRSVAAAAPRASGRDVPAAAVTPVDFRRPSRIGRDAVVALESTHEAFSRRLITSWGASTHAALEIEHLATEQLSVDDYVRTLPSPTALATLRVGPLGANALMDLDLPLALILVERLLGGAGEPGLSSVTRRPTDLEIGLMAHELLTPAVGAIDEALRDLDGEPSELLGVETTPQPLQLSAPGEMLLLLTYKIELRGDVRAQGLLSLGYPVAPLMAQLDRLISGTPTDDEEGERASVEAVTAALMDADLDVRVRLGNGSMSAASLAALAPGDVLRLDHPVERPTQLVCDDREVGSAHIGRRGRRLAIQVVTPPAPPRPRVVAETTQRATEAYAAAGAVAAGTPAQDAATASPAGTGPPPS